MKDNSVKILNDEGSVVMTVESLKRDGDNLVIDGRLMGAWKSKMYITPDTILKMLKLLIKPSFLLYIILLPIFIIKSKLYSKV